MSSGWKASKMRSNPVTATAWTGLVMIAVICGCAPGGGGGDALTVTVSGGLNRIACVGDSLTLTAAASGGTTPRTFRWSQERGADVLGDAVVTGSTLKTGAFAEEGEYSFRVLVTDSGGAVEDAWVLVRVGPEGGCDEGFEVIIDGPESVGFSESATLTAFAGSAGEVEFSWEVRSGSADLTATEGASTSFEGESLGRVTVRLTAREVDTGLTATAEASVDVVPAITVQDLHLLRIGETLDIEATVEPETEGATFAWTVEGDEAELVNADAAEVTVSSDGAATATLRIAVTAPAQSGDAETVTATRDVSVVVVADFSPRVVLETELGDLVFELEGEAAPLNTANFLRYVDEGFYDGVTLHRYSCERDFQTQECRLPFVIQGGGYTVGDAGLELKEPTHDPVPGEQDNGLSNTLHTVGMALASNDPDSASTQFYINLNDENERLDGTFTVFARVISGTEIVDAITEMETRADPITGGRDELLVDPVVMTRVRRE